MPHTHWLYGSGPDKVLTFKRDVDRETDRSLCAHDHICSHKEETRCVNHDRGRASGAGCAGCLHSYTRYDRQPVPCFHCEDFLPLASLQLSLPAGEGRDAALKLARRQQADTAFAGMQVEPGVELGLGGRWQVESMDCWFRHVYLKADGTEEPKSVAVDFRADSPEVLSIRLVEYRIVRHDQAA